ncbi:rho GDP-dissociation inhibitor 2-like [Tigriopus californicus]|uniref:rho GDP-dissociation inhibitor 2-like n=1 Tax=Tigriopus californicus TaxID=6832 RepID=UPI0027D9DE31|nr:rho GDP-dissociation inhibitor 2-like [Tigriopus californicus]
MSQPDAAGAGAPVDEVDVADEVAGYKPPKEKTLEQILQADEDDAALKRYKATLLGAASEGAAVVLVEPDNPSNVIVKKLFLVVEGRPDVELDLTQDLAKIKKTTFTIKEGIQFRIRIEFIVQREIVTGLKYVQKTSRMGVTVDKMSHMVGSYGPKTELQSYTTPVEDAPTGMTGRGTYHVHSLFSDDDKKEYLKWDWSIDIKKDW